MIKSTRDALNNFTTYEYYPSTTNLKEVTYPEGNSVEYTYDARDNVTGTIAHPKTGSGTISTSATYSSTCTNPKKCNKPEKTTAANDNITNHATNTRRQTKKVTKAPKRNEEEKSEKRGGK